ncbi:hypothetical protein OTK49_21285 [Vibrio coralliirubri]|uniref:hypothetical protein n=1 Tax=Vibrio coralliirubri TaxID=1516159 RepID=UPI002284FC81|nr:hypothetical protein [Vibrio coralliirubri]MCY9865055.1 hypothetical protein [Vibrio coralliirubri]
MSSKYVTYKGQRNEILSETRTIIFSVASANDADKPNSTPAMVVELDAKAPLRLTPRYIQTILDLEAKYQDKDPKTMVFANVIVERYQRYQLTSVMQSRSGTVTSNKLYQAVDGKFALKSTKLTDDMH